MIASGAKMHLYCGHGIGGDMGKKSIIIALGVALIGMAVVCSAFASYPAGNLSAAVVSIIQAGGSGKDLPARFHDNGDGTISDRATGLIWLKNGNIAGKTKTWKDALSFIEDFNKGKIKGNCGYTDWRLPAISEMASLVNYNQAMPYIWLNKQGFIGVTSGYYWSCSPYLQDTLNTWTVSMYDGHVGYHDITFFLHIWPVRSVK
jgi:hypothetical protein